MSLSFSVLASGSAGNACFLQAHEAGLLIDIGLGPRKLAHRLHSIGATWNVIKAVLLTHTHSDHWSARTLAHLKRHRIPLYCHPEHRRFLQTATAFNALDKHGLLRSYESLAEFMPLPGLSCKPIPLRHDSGTTFGFRFGLATDLFGVGSSLAYVADLGCWDEAILSCLLDTELIALEFNHDVTMQLNSGRHPLLIQRVLGEEGHLSNDQAAELLRAIKASGRPGRLRHLVQLHLSRQCNTPELALLAARTVLDGTVTIHSAKQEEPLKLLRLGHA